MFRMRRRILVCALSPMVSFCSVAIGIYFKAKPQDIDWDIVWLISGILIACALGATYYANIRPLRDPATNGRLLLETVSAWMIAYGKTKNIKIRLNILIVYRSFWSFRRYFRIAWNSWNKTKDFYPDGAVTFHISKGVAGLAFALKTDRLVDMEEKENQGKRWKFTPKEEKKFPAHTMIWSWPIFELNKDGDMTGKILGTLNLDSLDPGAFDIVLKDPEFYNRMLEFRELACKVASC
jgi:hypothetical protein